MATVFAEAMLSTAASIAPRAKRSQERAGWCASEEPKAEILATWQEKETAKELMHANPDYRNLRKSSKTAGKRLERVRIEVAQRFFEKFVGRLELCIIDDDQKGMDFEGKLCGSLHINKAEGSFIRDIEHIRDR